MLITELTPMRKPRHIWAVHHNNNALRIKQGKPIKVKHIGLSKATRDAIASIEAAGPNV